MNWCRRIVNASRRLWCRLGWHDIETTFYPLSPHVDDWWITCVSYRCRWCGHVPCEPEYSLRMTLRIEYVPQEQGEPDGS